MYQILRIHQWFIHSNTFRFVFRSVHSCRARSGSSKAGEKAEALLHKMEVLSRMDQYNDVRPDTISFNTCIKGVCFMIDVVVLY